MKEFLRKVKHKTRIRTRAKVLAGKAKSLKYAYDTDGLSGAKKVIKDASKRRINKQKASKADVRESGDVLIVSINDPLLDRYRSDHMIEALRSTGVKVDKIYYFELTEDYIKRYNVFIFYRVPWLPKFKDIFKQIDYKNKVAIYAIDDLVIDTKYTNKLPTVQKLNSGIRKLYDEGVNRHKKVLEHCKYAVTTTNLLADELKKFKNLKEVYTDRNAMSEEMIYYANEAKIKIVKDSRKIVIGYFSGTTTHDEDFKMIAPALIKLLKEDKRIYIKLAGKIETPDILKDYKDRIIFTPFVDWRKLPFELKKCDIILSPLQDTFFNRAKSEIKWAESSLVGVPVVASKMGAFEDVVKDRQTGVLVKNTSEAWYRGIKLLLEDKKLYDKISKQANEYVLENCTTTGRNAVKLNEFISRVTPKVIAFGGLNFGAMSGGNLVIKKHMEILRQAGNIVYGVEGMGYNNGDKWQKLNKEDDKSLDIFRINSSRDNERINLAVGFDKFVATFWASVGMAVDYQNMNKNSKKLYLVQGKETDFYKGDNPLRQRAMATYRDYRIEPVTISRWCQNWLKEDFDRIVKYAPNGIDLKKFKFAKRDWNNKKIKILIEGDSSSDYKRVDESFKVANRLDRSKFEVSYLSYNAKPKDWYKVDKAYLKVPHDEISNIYLKHDILIKSSILESFSYPPLEMMATGGVAVLVQNGGNSEYIEDGVNALTYEEGNIDGALQKVNELVSNKKLYDRLAVAGRKTAEARDWNIIKNKILKLYE